jgi:hypothetical protein
MNPLFFIVILTSFFCFSCGKTTAPSTARAEPAASVKPSPENQRKSSAETNRLPNPYGPPVQVGVLEGSAVKESSGIVASRVEPNLYWTHNDSGDGPFIYAFDGRGKRRGVWRVAGANAEDWEDIAAGPGPEQNRSFLYIGDTGDNDEGRKQIIVYRIPEPVTTAEDAASTKREPRLTETAEAIRLRYPDGHHDAETLLVHPQTGDLYIITKTPLVNPGVYKAAAPLNTSEVTTLVRIGYLSVPNILGGTLTGGDISPDGRRVALCDYMQAYEIELPGNSQVSFDAIWKQPIAIIPLGRREQGEAICYRLDGKALLATSEGKRAPLIEVVRK